MPKIIFFFSYGTKIFSFSFFLSKKQFVILATIQIPTSIRLTPLYLYHTKLNVHHFDSIRFGSWKQRITAIDKYNKCNRWSWQSAKKNSSSSSSSIELLLIVWSIYVRNTFVQYICVIINSITMKCDRIAKMLPTHTHTHFHTNNFQ